MFFPHHFLTIIVPGKFSCSEKIISEYKLECCHSRRVVFYSCVSFKSLLSS